MAGKSKTPSSSIDAEKKLELILDLLKEKKEPEEICRYYGVSAEEAALWKEQFLADSRRIFKLDPPVIAIWKRSLRHLLDIYKKFSKRRIFFPCLFLFFLILNIACYWLGVYTAFSELLAGDDRLYYFKIQFPVGFLGALFDSLSFFVTVYIIKRALKTASTLEYIGHLSIDLIIAAAATAWVLFVFWLSGWLIGLTESDPQQLAQRTETYEKLVVEVVKNPWAGWRNIYFGIVMGFSTMLPSLLHISMFLRSVFKHMAEEE